MPPPLDDMLEILPSEQIVCKAGVDVILVEFVFTTTVEVIAVPVQPFAVGVIVNVTVTEEPLVLVRVPVISPVPLDAIPVTEPVLFLVQL